MLATVTPANMIPWCMRNKLQIIGIAEEKFMYELFRIQTLLEARFDFGTVFDFHANLKLLLLILFQVIILGNVIH